MILLLIGIVTCLSIVLCILLVQIVLIFLNKPKMNVSFWIDI